jgi:DNA-binding XRE family transcriptional regulator
MNKFRYKVTSLLELQHLASRKAEIRCEYPSYMSGPLEARIVLERSCRSVLKMIEDGAIYSKVKHERPNADPILSKVQEKVRELGLSHRALAEKLGVTKTSVESFLNSESVTTKKIDHYIKTLNLEIKVI